jgi:hypothetical protein
MQVVRVPTSDADCELVVTKLRHTPEWEGGQKKLALCASSGLFVGAGLAVLGIRFESAAVGVFGGTVAGLGYLLFWAAVMWCRNRLWGVSFYLHWCELPWVMVRRPAAGTGRPSGCGVGQLEFLGSLPCRRMDADLAVIARFAPCAAT